MKLEVGAMLGSLSAGLSYRLQRAFGLSIGGYRILELLTETDEGLEPWQLAGKLGLARPSVLSLLDTLEKEKCVERLLHPGDSRRRIVKITRQGQRKLDAAIAVHKQVWPQFLSLLSPPEVGQLAGLLKVVYEPGQNIASAKPTMAITMDSLSTGLTTEMNNLCGMTLSGYRVLQLLAAAPVDLTLGEIAAALGIANRVLTKLVDTQQKLARVRRSPNSKDRRSLIATMTTTGLQDLEAATAVLKPVWEGFLSHLGDDEVVRLFTLLRKAVGRDDETQAA